MNKVENRNDACRKENSEQNMKKATHIPGKNHNLKLKPPKDERLKNLFCNVFVVRKFALILLQQIHAFDRNYNSS